MRNIAVAVAAASLVGLCTVHASAAAHWVKWHDEPTVKMWLDLNSVSRQGDVVTYDVIQGEGDPAEVARDPDLHLKNRINCVRRTHDVYSAVLDAWSGEGPALDNAEDRRVFALVCKRKP